MERTNIKKPYLLVDSSYVSFHRFFATLIWFTNVHPHIEVDDEYDWTTNEIFMKHFDETYMKNLLKFRSMYNIPFENMVIVRDCPRETIWRMDLYPEYKGTRKNTCSYKNKKYNIGNVFRHIYHSLYPRLEEQYKFKILKVDNAEADDVIAVLANKIRDIDKNRLVVIISNDNDYLQLVNEKTLIWSLQNRLLNTKVELTAEELLLKKILRGDESDNIPSIVGIMDDNELNNLVKNMDNLMIWLRNNGKVEVFEENRKLIDFNYIPDVIRENILIKCVETLPEVKEVKEKKEEVVDVGILSDIPKEFWKNTDTIKVKTRNGLHIINNVNHNVDMRCKRKHHVVSSRGRIPNYATENFYRFY